MSTEGKTEKQNTVTTEEEVYVVNYYITVNFRENCGVENVTINQTGKPKDPPPCPPGGC